MKPPAQHAHIRHHWITAGRNPFIAAWESGVWYVVGEEEHIDPSLAEALRWQYLKPCEYQP